MSKRPKSANSFMSRLRRPFGRLRDLPIWSKLGLIMIVPTIATVVVGTNGLIGHINTASNASRARDLAALAEASGGLVHGLQDERAEAVLVLGARDRKIKQRYLQAYSKLHEAVDEAKGPYSRQRTPLTDLPVNFNNLLGRIDQNLADLPATRSQVVNGKLPLTEAARAYEVLISDLLDIRDAAAQLSGDTELSERMRAAAATARTKEFLSVRRIVVHRALIDGSLTPALRTEYIATETGQQQALQSFKAVANRRENEFYDQTVAGSDQRLAENFSGYIKSKTGGDLRDALFDADTWDSAMVGNAKLIRAVEVKLDSDVGEQATALRDNVQRQLFIETGVLLAMLLLAILFAWLLARSMARSLRELRHGALSIAQYGLPQAVARLRDPQLSAQMSPVQLANQIAEPLPVHSKDEFGQVTEAFNAVHLEAVRTAAEQAALRSSVATMFVNLARRSQILVDRLIGHLDRLERGEEDPDRLAELFQLDHLATRMRRNDENLLVLAGADSTRVQREPAALIDVLRAAQSEVEHYTRIEFGVVDRDIEVAAHAVNDMVHLIAELFDNATSFSPPESRVTVEARRVGDRAVLYVEDRGIGITQDQLHDLNERLATPPQVDVAVSRMMGLVVVARLASRHGVRVELRPASDRGTVAEVTMPTAVLVPRALAGRVQQPGGFEVPGPQPVVPAQRPPFGAPLAIEGGPAGARPAERDTSAGMGGRPFDPVPLNGGGLLNPAAASRAMPAWSDLTGATTDANGADHFTPRPSNGHSVDPLPQRRASDQRTVDGEVTGSGPVPDIPRQRPGSESQPGGAGMGSPALPPVSSPPVASGPPVSAPPTPPVSAPPVMSAPPFAPAPPQAAPMMSTAPTAPTPPAWPPVAAPERDPATPPVPEKLAAALDMTAELPRVMRPAAETPVGAPAPTESRPRFADETMELPIFHELESAWFRTRRSTPEEATSSASPSKSPAQPAAGAATDRFVTVDAGRVAGSAVHNTSTGATGNAAMVNTPMPAGWSRGAGPTASSRGGTGGNATSRRGEPGWQTAADDGWRAASAASEVPVTETTQTGLPKRVPMAQLVPGGVDKPASSVQRRTPEAVRGLLSAYHRGVQRGRTHPKDDHSTKPGATPEGRQPQAGSGPVAGSGQKEQEG